MTKDNVLNEIMKWLTNAGIKIVISAIVIAVTFKLINLLYARLVKNTKAKYHHNQSRFFQHSHPPSVHNHLDQVHALCQLFLLVVRQLIFKGIDSGCRMSLENAFFCLLTLWWQAIFISVQLKVALRALKRDLIYF